MTHAQEETLLREIEADFAARAHDLKQHLRDLRSRALRNARVRANIVARTAVEATFTSKAPWRDDEQFAKDLIGAVMPAAVALINQRVGAAKLQAEIEGRLAAEGLQWPR